MGRGYNLVYFDPLSPGSKQGISGSYIFDFNHWILNPDGSYRIPKGTTFTPNPRLSFEATSAMYQTAFDFSKNASHRFTASGGIGPFSFSASASAEKVSKQTRSTSSLVIHSSSEAQVWVFNWKEFCLSKDFVESVKNLPKEYDQDRYFEFIKLWGTHYPVCGGYGFI